MFAAVAAGRSEERASAARAPRGDADRPASCSPATAACAAATTPTCSARAEALPARARRARRRALTRRRPQGPRLLPAPRGRAARRAAHRHARRRRPSSSRARSPRSVDRALRRPTRPTPSTWSTAGSARRSRRCRRSCGCCPSTRPAEDAALGSTTSSSRRAPSCSRELLPRYIEARLLHALLESIASEHGARMTAMDNATTQRVAR